MWFISCKNNNAENNHTQTSSYHQGVDDAEETGYKNGTYCAEVEYYNPNTGTRRTYDLNVEVENEQLTQIDWPNGGWLDGTHFSYENISSGECEIRSDRGYRYTITLGSFGGCGGTDGYRLKRQVEDDVASVTCPKCSGEKYSTDEYCSSCKRKIQDETCPKCGGYKFSSFDKMCSSCKSKMEEETCPKCGGEKSWSNKICNDCERKICPECGNDKDKYDDLCDDCKRKKEEEEK